MLCPCMEMANGTTPQMPIHITVLPLRFDQVTCLAFIAIDKVLAELPLPLTPPPPSPYTVRVSVVPSCPPPCQL